MSWWDAIVDVGSDVVDWAMENPTITGGVIGGLAGGRKGALTGAAIGYGLSNLAPDTFGGGNWEPVRVGEIFTDSNGGADGYYGPGTGGGRAPVGPASAAQSLSAGPLGDATQAGGGVASNNVSFAGTGNAGVTGEFGNYGASTQGIPNGNALGRSLESADGGGLTGTLSGGMKKISDWGQANPDLASMGIQLGAAALGNKKSKVASNAAEASMASQQDAVNRNNAVADTNNARSQVLADTSMAQGPQGMALQSFANANRVNNSASRNAATSAMQRGLSARDAANVGRRAKITGAGNASAAYLQGWETGSANQRAGLSTARAIQQPYQGFGFDANAANTVANSGANDTRGATLFAETLLGNPSAEAARRRAQNKGVMQ